MELYKLENGTLKKFIGGFVVYDNRIYTNPNEETVRLAGYKDLVEAPMPVCDEVTQYLQESYTEDDTTIYVKYKVMNIPQEEEGETNDT